MIVSVVFFNKRVYTNVNVRLGLSLPTEENAMRKNNRILKWSLMLVMTAAFMISAALIVTDNRTPAYAAGGDGSQGSPYIITTAAELAQLAADVNADSVASGLYYRLGNDIDLSAYKAGKGWIPIGF